MTSLTLLARRLAGLIPRVRFPSQVAFAFTLSALWSEVELP